MNMSIEFKKFYNKILLDMKTFEVTIDHILVYIIGSIKGLYVSFLIRLYYSLTVADGKLSSYFFASCEYS